MKWFASIAFILLSASALAQGSAISGGAMGAPPSQGGGSSGIVIDIDGEISFTDQTSITGTYACDDWPCPVFVWALDTTAPTLTSNPKHDLSYRWDFDDDAAGARTIGGHAFDRDEPVTPQAFYRYASSTFPDTCSAGACNLHTVTLTVAAVSAGTIVTSTKSFTVEEIDPDALFSGLTTCYHDGTIGSGCPAGATDGGDVDTAVSAALNDCNAGERRIMLKGGVTFTGLASSQSFDTANRCLVTSYGTGKATLSKSWTSTPPFRLGNGGGGTVHHNISVAGSGTAETAALWSKVVSPNAENGANLLLSDTDLGTAGNGLHTAIDLGGGSANNLHHRIYLYGVDETIEGTLGAGTPINGLRVNSGVVANSTLRGATTSNPTDGQIAEHLIRWYLTGHVVNDLNTFDGAANNKNNQTAWRAATGETSNNFSVSRSAYIVHRTDDTTQDPTTPLALCSSNNLDSDIRYFQHAWVTQNIFHPGSTSLVRRNYIVVAPLTGADGQCSDIDIWGNVFQATISGTTAVSRGIEQEGGFKSNIRVFNNALAMTATGIGTSYLADMTASSGNICHDNVGYFASGAIDGCGAIADTGNTFVATDPFDFVAGDPTTPTALFGDFRITTASPAEGTGVLDAVDLDMFGSACPQGSAEQGVHCIAN